MPALQQCGWRLYNPPHAYSLDSIDGSDSDSSGGAAVAVGLRCDVAWAGSDCWGIQCFAPMLVAGGGHGWGYGLFIGAALRCVRS